MMTNEKIIALVKEEYLNKIPKIFRKHAVEGTCKLIAREHPDLYKAFEDGEPTAEEKQIKRRWNVMIIRSLHSSVFLILILIY